MCHIFYKHQKRYLKNNLKLYVILKPFISTMQLFSFMRVSIEIFPSIETYINKLLDFLLFTEKVILFIEDKIYYSSRTE